MRRTYTPAPIETVQHGAFHLATQRALDAEYDRAYRAAYMRYIRLNDCLPHGNDDEEWLREQASAARATMRALYL